MRHTATPIDMASGTKHKQRDGIVSVVKYFGTSNVLVSFDDSGYTTSCQASQVRLGTVKDRFKKSVAGVGYLGGTKYKSGSGASGIFNKCYRDWKNMLNRCYGSHSVSNPCYKGVTVCDEWHNYQAFAEWYEENYPKVDGDWHLDKDIISKGNRVYSPITCKFVTPQENYEEASAKKCTLISPLGEPVQIFNVSKFARDNGLSQSCLNDVTRGIRKSHKGWTLKND